MSLPVRTAKQDDRAFVIDSWIRSYEGAPAVRGAERQHYRSEMSRAINRLLDKATVLVMCDPSDEDTIVGWAAFTGKEFHYGYVKDKFRDVYKLAELIRDVCLDAYTFRGRHIEHALVGVAGCEFRREGDKITWSPPKGWRYTPRFTI